MQNSGHQDSDRQDLEQALRKHLARTTAPEELWARVRRSRAEASVYDRSKSGWMVWATAVAALAIVAGGTFLAWHVVQPELSVEAMAVEALNKGPEHLALKTTSAAEIRNWVKANSNIDIPLPGLTSKQIEIVGANLLPKSKLHGNQAVAEVSYRVGNYQAALFISKDPTNARTYPTHQSQTITPESGARVSSWSMRGQNYTLAWGAPGEFKTACLLCHQGSDRALN